MSNKITISSQVRVDQLKIIDIYQELAEEDDVMRQFLINLALRVNRALRELAAKRRADNEIK